MRGWLPAPVFNVKVNTVGIGPHRLGGRPIAATPQDPRALSLRAIAGTMDMFQHIGEWRKSRCFALPSLGLRAYGLEAAPFS
ncbi:hypothetical protein CKQ54_13465 [Rahnella variigena]|uniref:Uncharacterized protein n=1 Tax=Rahnella variigena TaxID=574964 RepID=A0ABX9PW60_9GAMM|nr:hypothetical protein D6D38_24140 [Rahnella variigena]RKF69311.1 hypothetical protein CKQ54_13465 [Rahnella variigena]